MHVSDVEKARLDKEHRMRNGYHLHDNADVHENQYIHKDTENKHARESKPSDYERMMEVGK